jgi:hypothetical protein
MDRFTLILSSKFLSPSSKKGTSHPLRGPPPFHREIGDHPHPLSDVLRAWPPPLPPPSVSTYASRVLCFFLNAFILWYNEACCTIVAFALRNSMPYADPGRKIREHLSTAPAVLSRGSPLHVLTGPNDALLWWSNGYRYVYAILSRPLFICFGNLQKSYLMLLFSCLTTLTETDTAR